MSVELHLPDLPEVPISLGSSYGEPGRSRRSWHQRLREGAPGYLPVMVMALLALASWWLLKNSPQGPTQAQSRPVSSEPDYTMQGFSLQRFDPSGRLRLRIDGSRLRHFPITDRIDVDTATLHAIAVDGRVTTAVALRALANGDGSEVQLMGKAEVRSTDASGQLLIVRGDFLDLFVVDERIESHLPVVILFGGNEIHAAGMLYENATRRLDLQGPMRAVLAPRATP